MIWSTEPLQLSQGTACAACDVISRAVQRHVWQMLSIPNCHRIKLYQRERARPRRGTYIFFSLDRLWHWVKASVSPLSTNRIAWQRPGIKPWPTWRMSLVRPPIRFQIVLHEALWLAGDAGKRGGAWWAADQSLLLISEKKWTNYQNRQFNLKCVFFFCFCFPVCIKLWGNWKFTWVIRFYVWGIFMSWHIYQPITLLSHFSQPLLGHKQNCLLIITKLSRSHLKIALEALRS